MTTTATTTVQNPILRRLFANETIVIGKRGETQTSVEFLDSASDFYRMYLEQSGGAVEETEVRIYEQIEDATLDGMFRSFGHDLDSPRFMMRQIIEFCVEQRDKLCLDGAGTFFLFKGRNEFFVAVVHVRSGNLSISAHHLDDAEGLNADYANRVVVRVPKS